MQRALLGLTIAAILAFAGYLVWVMTLSDEDKIRMRLQEMAEDFNNSRPGPCVAGLHDDFQDVSSEGANQRVGKQEIRAFLARLAMTARETKTKKFLYRVSLPADEISIEIPKDAPETAKVSLRAVFEKRQGEAWSSAWEVDIEADLQNGDAGWQVTKSRHKTISGGRLR